MLRLLLTLLLAAPIEPKPRFCIAGGDTDLLSGACSDVAGQEIEMEKASAARSWIWLDATRATIALGTLPAGESKVTIDAKPTARLTLEGSSERGWPAATSVTLGSWKFTLPREVVSRVRAIAASEGLHDLRIAAPHHLVYERHALKFSRAKPAQIGLITLKPLPRLRGRFVDPKGGPLADVQVVTSEGTVLATSDATGEIREELTAALPERLFVRAAGFGHRTVEITRSESDFDFGTVRLTSGATLTVHVERNGDAGPITVSLLRTHEHSVDRRTTLASGTIDAAADTVELRDLEARDYVLALRGDEPLEAVRQDIEVGEGDNGTKTIRLEPRAVTGYIHQGTGPMANVNLQFISANAEWRSSAVTDARGRFRSMAWREGNVNIDVGDPSPTSYSTDRPIGPTDTDWDIDVPDRRIRGIVVDRETGNPVPVHSVDVSYRCADSSSMFFMPAEDSRFELGMLEPGHYEFRAGYGDYLSSTVVVELQPLDRIRDVRIELQRGFEMPITVLSADGSPVASAEILALPAPDGAPRHWLTDGAGVATPRLEREETLPLWVVAPADSFAFVTLIARKDAEPARVVLPPDNATIALRVSHADGTPAVHAHLFFSYNGHFAPDDVRIAFLRRGVRLLTGSDGTLLLTHMPAGEYDFYTLEVGEEYVVLDGPPAFPGTHASILPGENRISLRVSKKF